VEMELQYVYTGTAAPLVPTRLADLELGKSSQFALLDTYYDTERLDLRRNGCSLRVRQSDGEVLPRLTLKGPARRRSGAKVRYEAEVEIAKLPAEIDDIREALRALGLLGELERLAESAAGLELQPIGTLRNTRSEHRYEHGLHRLDLTWDELQFPTGPPQTRLEVEAHSDAARRLLGQAAAELEAIFGGELAHPERGKTRELCERLYPELLAA
jgi:inorganic triphosphatase YgiF